MNLNMNALSNAITERLGKGNDLIFYIDGVEITASFSDKWESETYNRMRDILLTTYSAEKIQQ